MAINFPNNPAVNDTFTVGSVVYTWNGTSWTSSVSSASGGASSLSELEDVDLTTVEPVNGNVLSYNGTEWVPFMIPGSYTKLVSTGDSVVFSSNLNVATIPGLTYEMLPNKTYEFILYITPQASSFSLRTIFEFSSTIATGFIARENTSFVSVSILNSVTTEFIELTRNSNQQILNKYNGTLKTSSNTSNFSIGFRTASIVSGGASATLLAGDSILYIRELP